MVSPQSVAVACAAVGLVGKESALFKTAMKYSLIFLAVISLLQLNAVFNIFLKNKTPIQVDRCFFTLHFFIFLIKKLQQFQGESFRMDLK